MTDKERYNALCDFCSGRLCSGCLLRGHLCRDAFDVEDVDNVLVFNSEALIRAYNILAEARLVEPEPVPEYVGVFDVISLLE